MGTFDAAHLEIGRLARHQHGVVTRGQLNSCGFSNKRIRTLTRQGQLRRAHRGVYLVGSTTTWLTPFAAAALAGGARAAVSRRSGVYLLKLLPLPARPGPVHITAPNQHRVGDDRLIVHETTHLPHYEIRDVEGIPVTSPIRTLIDFAGDDATEEELDRAVAEAFARGMTNRAAFLKAARKAKGRRGAGRVRALLRDPHAAKKIRSRPERRLSRLLHDGGIDDFETNARIGPWEVDVFFREVGLVVEVDVYSTHSSPRAFERDRAKTTALEERGLSVHRVTDVQMERDPTLVVDRIKRRIADLGALRASCS
jgi:very-short-patch-repair endonuclease